MNWEELSLLQVVSLPPILLCVLFIFRWYAAIRTGHELLFIFPPRKGIKKVMFLSLSEKKTILIVLFPLIVLFSVFFYVKGRPNALLNCFKSADGNTFACFHIVTDPYEERNRTIKEIQSYYEKTYLKIFAEKDPEIPGLSFFDKMQSESHRTKKTKKYVFSNATDVRVKSNPEKNFGHDVFYKIAVYTGDGGTEDFPEKEAFEMPYSFAFRSSAEKEAEKFSDFLKNKNTLYYSLIDYEDSAAVFEISFIFFVCIPLLVFPLLGLLGARAVKDRKEKEREIMAKYEPEPEPDPNAPIAFDGDRRNGDFF